MGKSNLLLENDEDVLHFAFIAQNISIAFIEKYIYMCIFMQLCAFCYLA